MNRSDAQKLAEELIAAFCPGWTFRFDSAVSRFGMAQRHLEKAEHDKIISLSGPLVDHNEQKEVEQTIRHEIAHALAGHRAGHGPQWQRIARSLGHTGIRCYDPAVVVQPPGTYTESCGQCGATKQRYYVGSMAKVKAVACTPCCRRYNGGRFDARFILTLTKNSTGKAHVWGQH